MEDLAFSGLQEFARQWLLVGRRKPYVPGSGLHQLSFHTGGSAGFSGHWAVDIDEGTVDEHFAGRHWEVSVRSGPEEKEREEKAKDRQVVDQRKEKAGRNRKLVMAALRECPDGETLTGLRKATGIETKPLHEILDAVVDNGRVERTDVEKPSGSAGTRRYSGFKLSRRSRKRTTRTPAA